MIKTEVAVASLISALKYNISKAKIAISAPEPINPLTMPPKNAVAMTMRLLVADSRANVTVTG